MSSSRARPRKAGSASRPALNVQRICLVWLGTPTDPRPLALVPIYFRATPAQRQWLDQQRRQRGIPLTTVVQLALEQAMKADPLPAAAQAPDHDEATHGQA